MIRPPTEFSPRDNPYWGFPFSVDTWIGLQKCLVTVDVIMTMLSRKYKMKLVRDYRGEWPSRTLRKRRWHKVVEIRIFLNPQYDADRKVFFQLNQYVMVDLAGFLGWQLEDKKVTIYTPEQMEDREVLQTDLERIVAESLSGLQ